MTTTGNDTGTMQRPDTREMIVVHRVFRPEIDPLARMVRAVPAGNTARARHIAGHFADYQLGLHHHHTGEDDLVWPLLLARVDLEADTVLRMEAQHETVAGTLDEVARHVPAWVSAPSAETGDPLADAITAHGEALREHLADEEQHVLPLIAEHLTVAEWAQLGERFVRDRPRTSCCSSWA